MFVKKFVQQHLTTLRFCINSSIQHTNSLRDGRALGPEIRVYMFNMVLFLSETTSLQSSASAGLMQRARLMHQQHAAEHVAVWLSDTCQCIHSKWQ